MKKTIHYLLLAAVLGLTASIASAAHIKLFVLTGQSNSLGTTNGGEGDPTSGSDPADSHVMFLWHNVVNATTSLGDSGGVFTTLQDQQGGFYGGSDTHWGPEMEFARTLYRAGVRDFGVIKASRGGGGNTFWFKGSPDDHMYVHVSNTVAAATADLTANGHTFEIVGLLYLQGESDNSTEAAAAGTRLKALTDNLRMDLPGAASLHTVAAGTTAQGNANDDTSRANQAAIAASTSYIDFFPNLDLQDRLAPDGLHLNKAGKTVVGSRFAHAFFDAGIVSRHYGQLVFVGDSITQGGNGRPSYRYQVFKNLANEGVTNLAASGYAFVGSVTGAFQNNAGSTPDVNGQTFANQHDGHWGWRAFWENARLALPAGRYNVNNLGQGTLENWTGQTGTFVTEDQGTLAYTGTSYLPDTAVIMIGINDMAGTSSATQARDDIGLLVDQLQAANGNVSIFISQTLHTDQGNATLDTRVETLNGLLPALAASKTTAGSSVWVIETDDGFDPALMTYDRVHPNTAGETFVGDRISSGLGLVEASDAGSIPLMLEERAGDKIGCLQFEGSDIYNSGSFASGWSPFGDLDATPAGAGDLTLDHPGGAPSWIEGTASGWSDMNGNVWTFETRLKFNTNPGGIMLWLSTGTHRILIEIHGNRTQDYGANSFNVAHNNLDGNFHTFTIKHDPAGGVYHVWRDGALLTDPAGAPFDQTGADDRLILGDYTGGSFGDGFNVTIDYMEFCRGFEGNEIYGGTGWINGWDDEAQGDSPRMGMRIVNTTDLQVTNMHATGGSWLEGTGNGWSAINDGYWTFETRLRFDANPHGFMLWLGTGEEIAWIEIYADRTQDSGDNVFNVAHNNVDGAFHTFRVGHDPSNAVYHVWRDGERITPLAGAGFDSGSDDERMILGDYTSGTFGNNFDVTIDYIRAGPGNVYLPPGADADGDGMSDLFEFTYFGDLVAALPGDNGDGDGPTNLEEYIADTSPIDGNSYFRISTLGESVPDTWNVTTPDTSTRRNYTLHVTGDLTLADPWGAVSGQGPVAGNGGDLVFSNTTAGATAGFYRVDVAIP